MPRTTELEWSAFGYAAIDWVEAWDSKDQTDIYGLVMSSISWQEVLFDIYLFQVFLSQQAIQQSEHSDRQRMAQNGMCWEVSFPYISFSTAIKGSFSLPPIFSFVSKGDNPVSKETLRALACLSVSSRTGTRICHTELVACQLQKGWYHHPEALLSTAKAHVENRRLERELKNLRALASRQRGEALVHRDIGEYGKVDGVV